MKRIYKYLWCLALPLLCVACTDTDYADSAALGTLAEGRASVTLNITTPESFSTRTRAISEENESVLEDKFAVFAFDETTDALLFAVKTGDVNAESNLNDASSAYGDYTGSPSMAWHEDASGTGGRLYIEYDETAAPLRLLVLANVDIEEVATLLGETQGIDATITTGMTFAAVTDALQPALDYDVTDENLTSIPMAGECELENGITLGATGSVSLRRSVAKFTVRVEYTGERIEGYGEGEIEDAPFSPVSMQVVNLNATYATVYSPYTAADTLPNISTLNSINGVTYSPEYSFTGWTYNEVEDIYYQEIVFYVAETENSREDAYTDNGNGTFTQNNDNPRISVLVEGTYIDYTDNTTLEENWYRLDLIPESAESGDEELQYILRNHHYRFVISDVTKRGSSSLLEALELSIPDNEPHIGQEDFYVQITDEDILSVTVETNVTGGEDRDPYYVGVSSTSIELDVAEGTAACARVKVETNFDGWTIDQYSIPYASDESGNHAISFVWVADTSTQEPDTSTQTSETGTLWLWLDYPEDVVPGETYVYYIVAGNIRKKMRIAIVDSSSSTP